MKEKSRRQAKRDQFRRKQTLETWGGRVLIGAVILLVIVFSWVLLSNSFRGNEGQAVPTEEAEHVPEGTIVQYSSDPPTSGAHYDGTMPSGFYEEGQVTVPFPEGYIVHSLEHGYVVFWYNCTLLQPAECETLKNEIKAVMDEYNGLKLIAFPRSSIQFPVVLTSWGYMLEMTSFDAEAAGNYIEANRSRPPAPEPNAP